MSDKKKAVLAFGKEQALELSEQIEGSLKIMNEIEFSDMDIIVPDINFYPDADQYLDSHTNEIHIGVYGIIDLFHPTDETDFMSALNYVRGHESQHRRSTVPKCYGAAISQGVHAIVKYIQQKVEGTRRRFRNENDYRICMDDLQKKYGIWVSWNNVTQIVAGIANSVEDGRIERIRSNRFPGFGNLRMVYRGIFWNDSSEEYPVYADLQSNTAEKLRILLNEILMLATCQLHCKGFLMAYADTPLYGEVKAFMPDIARAVMSGNARGIVAPVENICTLLAPYILEACTMSQQDRQMQQELEKMIRDFIKSVLDSMPANFDYDLSENDEDTDDGSVNSAFPQSDLVITLSDEEYDELMKKSKQEKQNSDGGIMIRREHPLETDEKEKGENGSAGSEDSSEESQKTDNASDASSGSSSSTGEGQTSDEKAGQGQAEAGKESGETQSNAQPDGSKSSDTKSGNKQQGEADSNDTANNKDNQSSAGSPKTPTDTAKDSGGNAQNRGKGKAEKHVAKDTMNQIEEAVKKAMQEAVAEAKAEAEKNLDAANINTAKGTKESKKQQTLDNTKPISPAEMKDICDFKELKRAYKVTENLPSVLAQRGKVLKRKNEQYFKSLSTPNVSFLDSGNIDASRIYALSFGDTEVFRKNGKDKKFDGCAYVLVDNSGSMAGTKRREACKAAAVIEEGFKGIMPLKIVAFDEMGCIIHEVIKNWDESLNKNCCWNFCLQGRQGSGNEDGYDIQIAERELLARPERKKMLLVLSDGTPGDVGYCKAAIDHARKAGIQVYGIYFEEGDYCENSYFEAMYHKDYICCPLSELDANMTQIFKKFSRS